MIYYYYFFRIVMCYYKDTYLKNASTRTRTDLKCTRESVIKFELKRHNQCLIKIVIIRAKTTRKRRVAATRPRRSRSLVKAVKSLPFRVNKCRRR